MRLQGTSLDFSDLSFLFKNDNSQFFDNFKFYFFITFDFFKNTSFTFISYLRVLNFDNMEIALNLILRLTIILIYYLVRYF